VIARLESFARRRAVLVAEIELEREAMARALAAAGKQVALAGLGLLAVRLLRRSRWFRVLSAGAAMASLALPVAARLLATRR
jgi:hypothetical protein